MPEPAMKERLLRSASKFEQEKQEREVIDFDEAVREQKAKAIEVRFDGSSYHLPANAPAWLPIFINRYSDKSGELSNEKNLELIEKLLGEDFANAILDDSNNFASMEAVNERILIPVMNRWGLQAENVDQEKKTGLTQS